MLRLLKCEFQKLQRRKILLTLFVLSGFFPLILTYMVKMGMSGDTSEAYLKMRFDYAYTMMMAYGFVFLMPCLVGILAAVLFFIERDCDTFKSLRTVPVTDIQLIFAKVGMLFLFGIVFCVLSTAAVAVFAWVFQTGIVYGLLKKFLFSILFGIMIIAASLPVVVMIIYCNRTYLLSILLAFFYSIFNWGMLGMAGSAIHSGWVAIFNLWPVLCVLNWTSGALMEHLDKGGVRSEALVLIPGNFYTFALLLITVFLSLWLMIRFYKKWTR